MKRIAGICAVSILAVGLVVYGIVSVSKKNRPVLVETPGTGTTDNSAPEYYGLTQENASPEAQDAQSYGAGESLTDAVQGYTQEVAGKITDIYEAATTVISSSQQGVSETAGGKSVFPWKDRESTSESLSTTAVTQAPSSVTQTQPSTTAKAAGKYEYSEYGFNPQYIDISEFNDSNYELVLINRDYIIPDGYVPKLAYAITGDTNSKKLDYRVAPHYNEMYQAAAKDGIYLTTVSGYRSYELQKNNFERKIGVYVNQGYGRAAAAQKAATIILPPGTSEHNAGLAMDIISLEQNFDQTAAYRWLDKHAQDYGFILRYPKDESVTKIIYEPWHWRYVGVENARSIKASGLCLEQWLRLHPAH